jgi:hypothetical protein
MTFFERGRPTERLLNERIKAVAGVIVNRDGRLLVGQEQITKPRTRKEKGQLSIPMETLKPFEGGTEAGMTKALMTEIATWDSMSILRKRLQTAGIVSVVPVESDVDVAVLLLKWKGDPKIVPFGQPHPDEFSHLKWIGVKSFMESSFVRPYARTVITDVLELNRAHPSPVEFKDISLRGFSPQAYEDLRQLSPDVEVLIPKSEA